jgi:hypothetical protein
MKIESSRGVVNNPSVGCRAAPVRSRSRAPLTGDSVTTAGSRVGPTRPELWVTRPAIVFWQISSTFRYSGTSYPRRGAVARQLGLGFRLPGLVQACLGERLGEVRLADHSGLPRTLGDIPR